MVGGLKSDNEDSRDVQDETVQNRYESTWGRQSEGELTPQDKPKKRRQRNLTTQDDSEYAPEYVALRVNPES